jgi:hypothetical protein
LSTTAAKLQLLFNFHLLFYYMAEAPSSSFNLELVASFNFNPRCQLHPSSTSNLLANFIPHRQLQPSSPPTSTLDAFQIANPVLCYFPPLLLDARSVLDAAAAR